MEKIYIEDNNSSKHDKNYRSTYRISIVLSFVVAAFALVSIVAFGFNQVSFAAGDDIQAKSSFTLYEQRVEPGNNQSTQVTIQSSVGAGQVFSVPIYWSELAEVNGRKQYDGQVFCLEHNRAPGIGETYTKSDEIDESASDYGVLYILNSSGLYNGKGIIERKFVVDDENNSEQTKVYAYLESYATQVALWVYLNEMFPSAAEHSISSADLNVIKNATEYSFNDSADAVTNTSSFGDTNKRIFGYIRKIVDEAKQFKSIKNIGVRIISKNISEVTDSNYYQTDAIEITADPVNDLVSYELKYEGIDGAFVVDGNGERLKSLSGLTSPTDKYYIRIPKDSVSEKAQTLKVSVVGDFNYLTGYRYVGGSDKQKVVLVKLGKKSTGGEDSIEIVGSPDTGMSTSQTIYFIGLIVLLCGVGIIYANAKPIKNL